MDFSFSPEQDQLRAQASAGSASATVEKYGPA